jgi:uncharacterized protein (DUF486 family)
MPISLLVRPLFFVHYLLAGFVVFAKLMLDEEVKWKDLLSFTLLAGAEWFAFAYKSTGT